MNKYFLTLLIALFSLFSIEAQCPFDPIITGDILVCPNQTEGTIYSDPADADSYQWYKRSFSGGTAQIIPGATDNFLDLVYFDDLLFHFSVDVTVAGCTERSPEVLIDGWVFALPSVTSTGDYTTDGNGNFLICDGDTIIFTLNNPYNTNITWFKDSNPIVGATSQVLEVMEPGVYTVSGAPDVCPDYIQNLGVDLPVLINTDPTVCDILTISTNNILDFDIYPNPGSKGITLVGNLYDIKVVSVVNILGEEVLSELKNFEYIDISSLENGIYFIVVKNSNTQLTKRLIKQ